MILFMFWNWVKQRERGGDRDGRTKEASRETARQKSREREREMCTKINIHELTKNAETLPVHVCVRVPFKTQCAK